MNKINKRLRKAAGGSNAFELKELLRDPRCDASYKDEYGWTALMSAAFFGREAHVRLLLPVSDALAADKEGLTALMHAAEAGQDGCVGLLLPVSEILATSNNGMTASAWARNRNNKSAGQFIDAYALAQSERTSIGAAVCAGASSRSSAIRV